MGVWHRRSLLLKLSGQTQLLEELGEISVDRLGAVTSAADGEEPTKFFRKVVYTRVVVMHICFFFVNGLSLTLYLFGAAPVLPSLAERPQLMTLWSECSGSAGLFHTTLDRVLKHLNQRYAAVLQERHPHSADRGTLGALLCSKM